MSNRADIEKALTYLDPHNRDLWVRMGAAIKSELGENGHIIWDNWSRQAKNYKDSAAKDVWRGLKPGMINIASLFYEARQNGYIPDKPYTPPSAAELAKRQAERAAAEQKAQQEREQAAQTAKEIAQKLWEQSHSVNPNHPYLIAKAITDPIALSAIRQHGTELLIPLRQNKEIVALQRIDEDGTKRFGKGSAVKGSAMIVGDTANIRDGFLMAEGFATAASLHQATNKPVVVTFNAGNLVSVAQTMARTAKNVPLVICADNDESRTGLNKAIEAARVFGKDAKIAMPFFTDADKSTFAKQHGDEKLPSDFNDLAQLRGIDSVRETIDQHSTPFNTADWQKSERSDWGNFPPVVRNGDLGMLKNEPEYAAAKTGDIEAAAILANRLLSPQTLADIKSMIGDTKPYVLPVHAQEGMGKNKIPMALAKLIAHNLNLPVHEGIVQANKVSRTGKGIDHRFAFPPAFEGKVEAGRDYLIVDDTLSVGGTIAALKGYVENRDGRVIGAAVMTAHQGALNIAVKPNMIEAIRQKHGDSMDKLWQENFNYELNKLTQGEAGHIRSAKDADTLRDRVLAARYEGLSGIHGSLATEPPQDIQRTADFITPSELPTQPLEANPSRGSSLSGASQMAETFNYAQHTRETESMRKALYHTLEAKGWQPISSLVDDSRSAYLHTDEGVRRVDVRLSDEQSIVLIGEDRTMEFITTQNKTTDEQVADIEQKIHELYTNKNKTAEYMAGHTLAAPQNRIELDESRLPDRQPIPPLEPTKPTPATEKMPPITGQATADKAKDAPEVEVMEPPKAPPKSIEARYLVADGRYLDAENGKTVLFEDKGRRLTTARADAQTINDMLEVAKAKGWDSIKLTGDQEFKRMAYIHAESQGIRTRGYSPSPEDIAMVQRLRDERSLNNITEEPKQEVNKTPDASDKAPVNSQSSAAKTDPEQPSPAKTAADKRQAATAIAEADRLMARSSMPTEAHINASHKADVDNDVPMRDIGGSHIPAEIAHAAGDIKHHATRPTLSVAKGTYDKKAAKLSRREFAKLKVYEKTALDVVNRLKPERRDRALANYYESTARHMHGSRLSFPEPLKVPEQQRDHHQQQMKEHTREAEPDIER